MFVGKSEFARRYLSKACTLEPGAGCVWLAYGHSFAADNEHDPAMAAYFKVRRGSTLSVMRSWLLLFLGFCNVKYYILRTREVPEFYYCRVI